MATTDLHFVSGGLQPVRRGVRMLGGAVDDGVQIDASAAGMVAANYTRGTISAWVMIPDIANEYAIIGFGDASAVEYIYLSISSGKIHGKLARAGPDVAWDMIATTTTLTPHKWHHVCMVQNAVKPVFYLDGELVTMTETDVTEPTYWFDTCSLIDGAHIGAADSVAGGAALTLEFKGYITDVKIWGAIDGTGALTPAQVLDDYHEVSNTTALYNYWTLDQTMADTGTGADPGTPVGDIIYSDGNEFSSRLTGLETVPLVADNVSIMTDGRIGYAYSILGA